MNKQDNRKTYDPTKAAQRNSAATQSRKAHQNAFTALRANARNARLELLRDTAAARAVVTKVGLAKTIGGIALYAGRIREADRTARVEKQKQRAVERDRFGRER